MGAPLIDFLILLTVAGGVVVCAGHLRSGSGPRPRDLLPCLAALLAPMLALRAGVQAADWLAAGPLIAGLLHAADPRRRPRR